MLAMQAHHQLRHGQTLQSGEAWITDKMCRQVYAATDGVQPDVAPQRMLRLKAKQGRAAISVMHGFATANGAHRLKLVKLDDGRKLSA